MGRIPNVKCPKCGATAMRRVYLQNPAAGDRPRHEPIDGWLYCDDCGHMHARRRQSNP